MTQFHAKDQLSFSKRVLRATVLGVKKFNPVYAYRTLREDIRQLREAKSIRDADICRNPDLAKSKLRVKLMATIAVSEFIGTYIGALGMGIFVQYYTGSAYKGICGTIIGDYFPAVIAGEITWLTLNREYYTRSSSSFLGKIKNFFKDMLPLHGAALLASMPAYAIGAFFSALVIAGINLIYPDLANKLPMAIVTEMSNVGVSELIYLTLFYNLSSGSIMERINERYVSYLKERYKCNSKI